MNVIRKVVAVIFFTCFIAALSGCMPPPGGPGGPGAASYSGPDAPGGPPDGRHDSDGQGPRPAPAPY